MAALNLKSLKQEEVQNIFKGIDTILSDCDGVLWVVDKPIEGVSESVKKLKENGKRFFYVTNNPTRTREGFAKQMRALGFDAKHEEVVSVSYLVATYLKSINFSKKAYLIALDGVGQELDLVGIRHTGIGPDIMGPDLTTVTGFVPDPEVGAVVISIDEHISYPKCTKAATYLSNPDVLFIATSMDTQLPIPNGTIPGPGAFVKCMEACTGRKATVLGKPEAYIKEAVIKSFNLNLERTLFIGDSIHADILLGKRCGIKTLLVLSGVTAEKDIHALINSPDEEQKQLIPDFYIDSLADIQSYL